MFELYNDDCSFDVLGVDVVEMPLELDNMVDEIIDEFEKKGRGNAVKISVPPVNRDDLSDKEMEKARLAKLRSMIQNGTFKVDAMAIARNLLESGNLDRRKK